MVAKTTSSAKPEAFIVVNNQQDKSKPSDKGRKSIKKGKVYLDDEQEFEIELYNPLKECVLCDIKLNGQSISKTGLVLKPGQRFYLDCFVDDKKKFIFSTYEVENTIESADATTNNGLLEVFFYKESVVTIHNWQEKFNKVVHVHHYDYYPYYNHYYPYRTIITCGSSTSGIFNGNCTTTISGGLSSLSNGNCTTTISGGLSSLSTTTGTYNTSMYSSDSVNCSYTSGVDLSGLTINNTGNSFQNISNTTPISSIETGRVEKGESSSQVFSEIDMDFDTNYISSTILQILPNSRKPVETKDIVNKKTGEINLKDILVRESDDVIELIKKLADLHSAGILTDDEFNTKKSELLSKI